MKDSAIKLAVADVERAPLVDAHRGDGAARHPARSGSLRAGRHAARGSGDGALHLGLDRPAQGRAADARRLYLGDRRHARTAARRRGQESDHRGAALPHERPVQRQAGDAERRHHRADDRFHSQGLHPRHRSPARRHDHLGTDHAGAGDARDRRTRQGRLEVRHHGRDRLGTVDGGILRADAASLPQRRDGQQLGHDGVGPIGFGPHPEASPGHRARSAIRARASR